MLKHVLLSFCGQNPVNFAPNGSFQTEEQINFAGLKLEKLSSAVEIKHFVMFISCFK